MTSLDLDEYAFRTVVDYAADGVWIGSPDGRIFSANPAACAIFAATEAQLREAGRPGISNPDDPAWRALRAERRRCGWARGVAPMFRLDGTPFLAEVSSAIFEGPSGEERTCVIVRDVTERVRDERRLLAYDEIAESLLAGVETAEVLDLVARHACAVFDASDAAIITPASDGDGVIIAAACGPRAAERLGQSYPPGGPGDQVMTSRQPLLLGEATATTRHRHVPDPGIGPAMMVPIPSGDTVLGALFVGARPSHHPYQDEDVAVAAQYASRAGVALALGAARAEAERRQQRTAEQLQRALDSRVVIEQAKGFLACLRGISIDEAFDRIRKYARSHNADIHSIATRVVERRLVL
jgi:PAS domain S-box-containing protein